MLINDRLITISTAGSRRSQSWPASTLMWSELVEKLRTPVRSPETLTEYLNMKKGQQDDLKDVGGFVAGTFIGSRRKADSVAGRDVVTLDLDNIPIGGTQEVLRRIEGLGCGYAVYSTRKHREEAPRLRILLPLDRTVTADEYAPIARKMAEYIGIEMCDKTTFEASRLMYWPSVCSDSIYVYTFGDKPFLSADGVLALYADWRDMTSWPQVPGVQEDFRRLLKKQEDPTTKTGVIGAFCRTYNIYRAMDEFIPGEYLPTDSPDRFTYAGGSTTGGAVIYDNGNFLYSHHATDPCSGKLVNSFDLVRLHKYGMLDEEAKPDTPLTKLPSYKAMCEFAVKDTYVAALANKERHDRAVEAFQGASGTDEDTLNWISQLSVSPTTGQIQKTTDNVLIILENDPLLKGRILYDEFAKRGAVGDTLPWDQQHPGARPWTDNDDSGARWYLEKIYNLTGKEKINDALGICANSHAFNEVKDYLNGLEWDGTARLERLFIDYLGAEDNEYVRAVTRKSFVAAVARALNPGCKYDTMPILTGAQGIGKSTLLGKMGKKWFTDGIKTFEGKEAAELIQGIWIAEIGELSAMNKSEENQVKQFLSQRIDRFRAAYGRHVQDCPRCCVFFGTSNSSDYLRDPTGGRRFWPIDVGVQKPVKNVFKDLDDEIDQLWAEAVCLWKLGEPLKLNVQLEAQAKEIQEQHREHNPKEGIILGFIEKEVPKDWLKWSLDKRRMFWNGMCKDVETVPRDRICAAEIWCELYGFSLGNMKRQDAREINDVLMNAEGWRSSNQSIWIGDAYGKAKGFKRRRGGYHETFIGNC